MGFLGKVAPLVAGTSWIRFRRVFAVSRLFSARLLLFLRRPLALLGTQESQHTSSVTACLEADQSASEDIGKSARWQAPADSGSRCHHCGRLGREVAIPVIPRGNAGFERRSKCRSLHAETPKLPRVGAGRAGASAGRASDEHWTGPAAQRACCWVVKQSVSGSGPVVWDEGGVI